MQTNKRLDLLKALLLNLEDTSLRLMELSSQLNDFATSYYEKKVSDGKSDIRELVSGFRANEQKIQELNSAATAGINSWYDFVKEQDEMKSFLFPVKFYLNARKLRKQIKNNNDRISSVQIENRFLKEQLTAWEQDLYENCHKEIKKTDFYLRFRKLVQQKEELITQIKYLIRTVPGLCPANIDISNIKDVMLKISHV